MVLKLGKAKNKEVKAPRKKELIIYRKGKLEWQQQRKLEEKDIILSMFEEKSLNNCIYSKNIFKNY